MIFDSLDNLRLYAGLNSSFEDICTFLSKTDMAGLAIGEHPINEHGAFASVNEYYTKKVEDCFIECHRKYIDVQMTTCGEEKIGVTSKKLCIEQPYDEQKDLQKLSGNVDFITLRPGFFAVFFPHDAHEPGVTNGNTATAVKKIVFKIPLHPNRVLVS